MKFHKATINKLPLKQNNKNLWVHVTRNIIFTKNMKNCHTCTTLKQSKTLMVNNAKGNQFFFNSLHKVSIILAHLVFFL